jgi:hypothetical protein
MQVYAIQNEANGKLYIGQHAGYDLLWYLREITEQHKERLSMSKKGKPLTEEHKAALRKPKRKANNVDARI